MKDDLMLVAEAIRYIEGHLREKLSLESIAAHVGFSKYYFTRLFSKYTGQSPYDYYRGRKLTQAIAYMQSEQCKIIDAAYEFGFSSPEVFARASSAVFGKSPSVIRKEIINGTFQGVDPISEGYLWFMNAYKSDPKLIIQDSLTLTGVGYFTEGLHDGLHLMSAEKRHSLGHSKDKPLFKVTWLDRQIMGYMNFAGQRDKTDDSGMLLTKTLPKLAWLVFDFDLEEAEIPFFFSYVYDRYLPENDYEIMLPLQMEVLEGVGAKMTNRLYIPVVP